MSSLRPPKYIWISFGWNIKPCRAGCKWNLWLLRFKRFLHLALKHLVLDVITGIKINETAPWPLYFLHRLFQLHVKMIFLCCFFFFLLTRRVCCFILWSCLSNRSWMKLCMLRDYAQFGTRTSKFVLSAIYLCTYLPCGPYISVAFKPLQSCV